MRHRDIPRRTFEIPVYWQMCGRMKIKAGSLAEAVRKAYGGLPLPEDRDYVEDSFRIDWEIIEADHLFPADEISRAKTGGTGRRPAGQGG